MDIIKISISLLLLQIGSTIASAADIGLSPPTQEVPVGRNFSLDVYLDPGGEEVSAAQFDIIYDKSLMTIADVEAGDFFSQNDTVHMFNPGTIDNQGGSLTGLFGIVTSRGKSISSSGIIARIWFRANNTASGTSEVRLTNTLITNPESESLPIKMMDASITVREPSLFRELFDQFRIISSRILELLCK